MNTKNIDALKWEAVVDFYSRNFTDGEKVDIDIVIYLIGVRELGLGKKKFKKDDKINLMHIAVCKLLSPYGFYELESLDEEGWPHYKILKPLPELKPGEQSVLMKKAVIDYFDSEDILSAEFMEIDKQNHNFVHQTK